MQSDWRKMCSLYQVALGQLACVLPEAFGLNDFYVGKTECIFGLHGCHLPSKQTPISKGALDARRVAVK
jgi:hypothetical protein